MDIETLVRDLEWLRSDIIGRNMLFETPFGTRPLVYADYTASGRALYSVENYIQTILQYYANTHTEDDFTGKTMTGLLHEAEHIIKAAVNAGLKGKIIFTESGTTGGIVKLQQILGVYWPPATRERVENFLSSCLERFPDSQACHKSLLEYINTHRPIVFVGPYEHHSNEVMWRQTLCDIVEIPLNEADELDLNALEEIISRPEYDNRPKIGSFSAASNVTGLLTKVYEVARLLHRHNALACFDFAACAPYVKIDMNLDKESYFDAIFLSPHKFLGGPGSCGILVFNSAIYRSDLPPTVGAGGTVDYVSSLKTQFTSDIETREKAGTPGILQAIRTALAFQVKQKAGFDRIDAIETEYFQQFKDAFKDETQLILYGPQNATKLPIIPFNIAHQDRILHPRFVTRLLNDLFGIQTRAGCSCAGPYGHHLMKIQQPRSDFYRCAITNAGYTGMKPGWVRLNLHYALDGEELAYLMEALRFVIESGSKFLPLYNFDLHTGEWSHLSEVSQPAVSLDIDHVYASGKFILQHQPGIEALYKQALTAAREIAATLPEEYPLLSFGPELDDLMFFYACKSDNPLQVL